MDECDEDDGGEREKRLFGMMEKQKWGIVKTKKAKGPPSPPLWNSGLPKKSEGKGKPFFFSSSYFHLSGLNHGHERRPHDNYLLSHESWDIFVLLRQLE